MTYQPITSLAAWSLVATLAPAWAQRTEAPQAAAEQPAQAQAQAEMELVAARGAAPRRAPDDLFPVASEDLAIAWPSDGTPPAFLDLVTRYGQLTGQRMLYSAETETYLENARIPLDRPTNVAPVELQGFFESLLFTSDFVLTIERAQHPRLVRVQSLQTAARNQIRSSARYVTTNELELMRAHPALLFTTVIELPNTDVRQVSNSLRTMITDANTMSLLPAGNSNSMVITGFGPLVAGLIEQLKLVDAASVVARPEILHELVRLRHGNAVEVAPLVTAALHSARAQRGEDVQMQNAGGQPQAPRAGASVLADARLNALLVSCVADELEAARQVIALLDVAADAK